MDAFAKDISESRLFSMHTTDPDTLADEYDNVLSELLEKHAPLKSKTITIHPPAPWYNNEMFMFYVYVYNTRIKGFLAFLFVFTNAMFI